MQFIKQNVIIHSIINIISSTQNLFYHTLINAIFQIELESCYKNSVESGTVLATFQTSTAQRARYSLITKLKTAIPILILINFVNDTSQIRVKVTSFDLHLISICLRLIMHRQVHQILTFTVKTYIHLEFSLTKINR